ncbi:hypothetical protein PHYPSEUDO_009368 [Phytophthora pseudosyringae]|uniref:AGC protein kinase n=1 Tax=Phytophthora pseudosyringae TaxID=221518 RepID=A0A8T1W952_9STRA|nr:hypothetical protein PHYPSEUDO_009368 [Phytophthora pseudosyringae]
MAHMLEARMMSRNPSASSLTAAARASRRKSSISGPSTNGSTVSSTPRSRRPSLSRGTSSSSGSNLAAAAASFGSATLSSSRSRPKSNGGAMATPNLIDLKTITAEEVEWEGYLYKQRKIVKSWTPRYITLQNRTVSVYKSKNHALAKEQHRGRWVIKQILSSLPSAGFGGSKLKPEELGFSFLATNGNLIHFIAASAVEKALWMHMMQLSLHNTTAREATMLQQGRPRGDVPPTPTPTAARSADEVVSLESSITTHLAEKFLADLVHLLTETSPENVIERLPSFLRQLSKDVELLFDLETCETTQPSCVFKGIYHGREGFVHFAALYVSKYLLATDVNEKVAHKADDDDHHAFCYSGHRLINTVSGSTTEGKFGLQTTFTPARRISRVVLSFRQRSASASKSRRVTTNPMAVAEHPACFHQYCLTKRSLALSFSDFDVVGVLGQGGFGTVVLVQRHLNPDEYFAIKIIDKQSGAESALKERRILSGVRHPFLTCLRFAFQTQTKLYLVRDPAERIDIDGVRDHSFFASINWEQVEMKEVEPPFIPPTQELMQNVHEHFRNMNVDETLGENPKVINGKKASTVANANDESHFDEFSFAYDKTRDTFDDLSMADEGWLVRQLQEGAAMRGRLNASDTDPVPDELGSEDEIAHPILNGQDSSESDEPEVEVTNI